MMKRLKFLPETDGNATFKSVKKLPLLIRKRKKSVLFQPLRRFEENWSRMNTSIPLLARALIFALPIPTA